MFGPNQLTRVPRGLLELLLIVVGGNMFRYVIWFVLCVCVSERVWLRGLEWISAFIEFDVQRFENQMLWEPVTSLAPAWSPLRQLPGWHSLVIV